MRPSSALSRNGDCNRDGEAKGEPLLKGREDGNAHNGALKQEVGIGVRGRKHIAVVKGTEHVLPNDDLKWQPSDK